MADWPRVINPEDRIKYLIQARAEIWEKTEWVKTPTEVWMNNGGDHHAWADNQEGVWVAYYSHQDDDARLVGEFPTALEARKALTDEVVVSAAVIQAWEDVAG